MSAFNDFCELLDNEDFHYTVEKEDTDRPTIRFGQKVGGVNVTVLLIFKNDYVKVYVYGMASITEEAKKAECLQLVNELNREYNFFKFYIDDDDDVIVESDVHLDITDGEFQPMNLMGVLAAGIKIIEDVCPRIMKLIWS